jgi:hypothetical protein
MATLAPIAHHLDLYAYWQEKRGVRSMPARGDIEARDIPALLPHVMIVEKTGDQFRYRLVGTSVVRAVGYDATGKFVGSYLADPKSAEEARAIWERVFTAAYPIFATGEFCFKSGAHHFMSTLVLPLSGDGMTVDMSISSLVTLLNPGIRPSRDWLRGLPVKVSAVIDVSSAEDLKRLCHEWEENPAGSTGPAIGGPASRNHHIAGKDGPRGRL